jgi:hypothetical protein
LPHIITPLPLPLQQYARSFLQRRWAPKLARLLHDQTGDFFKRGIENLPER